MYIDTEQIEKEGWTWGLNKSEDGSFYCFVHFPMIGEAQGCKVSNHFDTAQEAIDDGFKRTVAYFETLEDPAPLSSDWS